MDIKGFTYGFMGRHNAYRSPEGAKAQELLYQTGVNWMCLAVVATQKTPVSTEIRFDYARTPSDRDIAFAVNKAHENGVKVCLKPMVNCEDGTWRAKIQFPDMGQGDEDIYWNKWFKSYTDFMLYYAELAEELGCEMLCTGCEMCGTEHKEALWRKLIADIRGIYTGKLVYNTNHGHEDSINWFDALDYIGTSAYFPVAKFRQEALPYDELVSEMKSGWLKVKEDMRRISEKWGKQLLFMEIGCRSARGCASMPWDFSHRELPFDEDEQAAFYDSCLAVFGSCDWFGGVFWWDWSTRIYDSAETAGKDTGFNIHLKKAEEVLKGWYSRL